MASEIQTHGGQDISVKINFIDDFSVTTNFLGPVESGLNVIKNNVSKINHYPPQNYEPYKSLLLEYLYKDKQHYNNCILLGNGASELIDLLVKSLHYSKDLNVYNNGYFKPGSSTVQYLEYERTCLNAGYQKSNNLDKNSDITCIINPCNPTGEYKNITDLKKYIDDYVKPNSLVIVDESMQPWVGKNFRDDSLLYQTEYIKNKWYNEKIAIFIIHSWTKFFSCTGIRLGSLICPTEEHYKLLLKHQVPWSCNILALKYLQQCISDEEYQQKTWEFTSILRKNQAEKINKLFPYWNIYGKEFLSWLWIDTTCEETAKMIYNMAKLNGVPIRWGKIGYNMPTYIRVAVRHEKSFNILYRVLEDLSNVLNKYLYIHKNTFKNVIIKHDNVNIDKILCHENTIEERSDNLYNYLLSLDNTKNIPAIIVDYKTNVIIDGHHRLSVLKKLNIKTIPVVYIDYDDDNIIVHPTKTTTKEEVRHAGVSGNFLEPKSTQHMIKNIDNKLYPIIIISPPCYLD